MRVGRSGSGRCESSNLGVSSLPRQGSMAAPRRSGVGRPSGGAPRATETEARSETRESVARCRRQATHHRSLFGAVRGSDGGSRRRPQAGGPGAGPGVERRRARRRAGADRARRELGRAADEKAASSRAYGSLIDLFPSRADLRRLAAERLRLGDARSPPGDRFLREGGRSGAPIAPRAIASSPGRCGAPALRRSLCGVRKGH